MRQVTANPRTDDAEVFANFIGMAPLVNGPITHLYVADNELVKQGDPLFDIDDRPYAYALAHAKSDQQALKGEINDQRRIIAGKVSGVDVARAGALSSEASLERAAASVNQAKADVANAKAAVERADAEQAYASNNLHRIEPLLAKQFVTVDQVDQARTLEVSRSAGFAPGQLAACPGGGRTGCGGSAIQSRGRLTVIRAISRCSRRPTMSPRWNRCWENCREAGSHRYRAIQPGQLPDHRAIHARVTNLTISQGAYATAGQHIFTLIDTRVWWAVANFRETQLQTYPSWYDDGRCLSSSPGRMFASRV